MAAPINIPMLQAPFPVVDDVEGAWVPGNLAPVVDAHVHVFPDGIFRAVWDWFDAHGWRIRYRLPAEAVLDHLLSRGVAHVVALQYAHKPGIARDLNRFMAGLCRKFPGRVTGLATVFPGEDGGDVILREAFDLGLSGVKLHAHVQCFDMNAPTMSPLYRLCEDLGKPMLMHVGREPKSPAYRCDPYDLCAAQKLEAVLRTYPALKICVPHLGVDEFTEYKALTETYDTLWLDTAMVVADYLPVEPPFAFTEFRADRILYGSDFPNIPYAWDRELVKLAAMNLDPERLERVLWKNAAEFFGFKALAVK